MSRLVFATDESSSVRRASRLIKNQRFRRDSARAVAVGGFRNGDDEQGLQFTAIQDEHLRLERQSWRLAIGRECGRSEIALLYQISAMARFARLLPSTLCGKARQSPKTSLPTQRVVNSDNSTSRLSASLPASVIALALPTYLGSMCLGSLRGGCGARSISANCQGWRRSSG